MKKTPVLHMIDSLSTGGAERMAVNLVNALVDSPYSPHLCVTRELGPLRKSIDPKVGFLHLDRKNRFDLSVLHKYIRYVEEHNIRLVHAHSTSVFFALLMNYLPARLPILWHVHGVDRRDMSPHKKLSYQWASYRSTGVVCVSTELVEWSAALKSANENIWYLPNFIPFPGEPERHERLDLPGKADARVICVSNLKNPKDHATLLKAWKLVIAQYPPSQLLLVGGSSEEEYAQNVFALLNDSVLHESAVWLGERSDISALLANCQIGVLSSHSEGFPVTLLEYGRAKLGVVSTDTGQCAEILEHGKCGILVPPENPAALADALTKLLADPCLRKEFGSHLFNYVSNLYSQDAVLNRLFCIYSDLIDHRSMDI